MIGVSPPAQGTLAQAQRLRWVRGPTDRHAPHRRGARASPTPSGGARRWSCWRCTVTRCARCPTRSASSRRSRAARCASSRGTTTRSTPCSAPRQTPRLSWRSAASLLRRTNWTRLVPPPVLTGHVSSLRSRAASSTTRNAPRNAPMHCLVASPLRAAPPARRPRAAPRAKLAAGLVAGGVRPEHGRAALVEADVGHVPVAAAVQLLDLLLVHLRHLVVVELVPARGTRRVRLVRGEGRGVST